jgi:hypothetical protein
LIGKGDLRRDGGLALHFLDGAEEPDHRQRRLLRARHERPRCRTAEQRDEVASFQLIELHSIPASQGRFAGYRMDRDQSAGIKTFTAGVFSFATVLRDGIFQSETI